jgi:3-hydroxyisobutyrate dehydrogenase
VFEAVGSELFHLGPVGAGATAKVVNNLLSLGSYALQLEAMQIAAAYGIDEDAVTTVVTASQGDSRGIRTWGRMDRIRRGRREGRDAAAVYEQISKDLRTAAKVGGALGLVLPITASAAALLPSKLAERDRALDALAAERRIPRCDACRQELAAPFRAAGRHPECA